MAHLLDRLHFEFAGFTNNLTIFVFHYNFIVCFIRLRRFKIIISNDSFILSIIVNPVIQIVVVVHEIKFIILIKRKHYINIIFIARCDIGSNIFNGIENYR